MTFNSTMDYTVSPNACLSSAPNVPPSDAENIGAKPLKFRLPGADN